MKILVTGGAGFIGSHVVDRYIALGHDVVVLDNLSTGRKDNLNSKATFHNVDITDSDAVASVFEKERPDIVNHHAAQMDVRRSVADPVYDANINVIGLLNVLEASRTFGVKKFMFISSGGVLYGDDATLPVSENASLVPESPYGVTKLIGEKYLHYYNKVHSMSFVVLRYGNVYGPRQDPHGEAGVVSIFVGLLLNGKKPTIFGDGKQLRDYVFVADVVEANVLALEKGEGEAFNIGTGEGVSVNTLFDELRSISGFSGDAVHAEARKGELLKNYLNASKAEKVLDWRSQTSLRDGLQKTFDWFKEKKRE